jgi:hypothetical protein
MAIRIVEEICLITEDGERIEAVLVESVIDQFTMQSPSHHLEYNRYVREKWRGSRSRVIEYVGGTQFMIDGEVGATAVQCV